MNTLLAERVLPTGQSIQIVQGDLTTEPVDAIVNAANEHLAHGGGVAWTIVRAGGDVIQQESDDWIRAHGPVSHAQPAWTSGGLLPAKYVIHAVGPVWGESGDPDGSAEDAKLSAAVRGSLHVASELGLQSIAMPAISTGIFGFPKGRAADVLFKAIRQYFRENPKVSVLQVRVVLFDPPTIEAFLDVWKEWDA